MSDMLHVEVPPITSAMISITDQCTCACPYCFRTQTPHVMTYETLRSAVDFLIQNADACGMRPRIVFFGGEPTMEWDTLIVPIVRYIRSVYKKEFLLSMTTNMTLLDSEKVQFMRDEHIDALYSIDGGRHVQDKNRPMKSGAGSYDLIARSAPIVLKYFPQAHARMTLYRPTCGSLCESIQAIESMGFRHLSILPNLFDDWSSEDADTVREQMHEYGQYVCNQFMRGIEPLHLQQLETAYAQIIAINRQVSNGRYRDLKKCYGTGKCGFGMQHFATMDYLGNLYGCLHVSDLSPSSIFWLGDIYQGVDPDRTKNLISMCDPMLLHGMNCSTCKLSSICDGGCAPNNYLYWGDMNHTPPMYCYWNQIILDTAIDICNTLGGVESESFLKYFTECVRGGFR